MNTDRRERQRKDQRSILIILGCMIMCGPVFDLVDYVVCIPRPLWDDIAYHIRDFQMLGIACIGCYACEYRMARLKAALFLVCIWKTWVLIANVFSFYTVSIPIIIFVLNSIYLFWLYRLSSMQEKKPGTIPEQYAFYFLMPIHSISGLLQSVFLPWHDPMYESRVIAQGSDVWLVNRGRFVKKKIKQTDMIYRDGVKVSLRRTLSSSEKKHLDSLVGKKSIPGIRDCRKFVV